MSVCLVSCRFEPEEKLATFSHARAGAGALVSFVGYCRNATGENAVERLELQYYPGFTESEIWRLRDAVRRRYDLIDLLVVHRVGAILAGDAIVLVAALSIHRSAAFSAVSELMDYLKTDAPIWKKEIGPERAGWIEPSEVDHRRRAALTRKEMP